MSPRISRRRLVEAGAGATALLAFGGIAPPAPARAAGVPSYLRRAGYLGLEGTVFAVAGGAELRLVAVSDLVRAATEPEFAGRDDAFALILTGGPGLAAGTHSLTHDALGTFELFLAPVGAAGKHQEYEVVVDRSVRLAQAVDVAPRPMEQPSPTAPEAPGAPAEPADLAPAKRRRRKRRRKGRRVLRATAARRGGDISADVRVARGRGLRAVQLLLMRGEKVHARGFRRLRGRSGVRVPLRERRRVAPGEYWLHVTTTDRRGKSHTSRHRVTLR